MWWLPEPRLASKQEYDDFPSCVARLMQVYHLSMLQLDIFGPNQWQSDTFRIGRVH